MGHRHDNLIARARALRRYATPAERLLWGRIRDRQLSGHKFRRQYTAGPYIADFCCVGQRLIIELDGPPHATRQRQDQERTHWLSATGYRVVRFDNDEVLNQIDGVVEKIQTCLK